MQWKFAVTQMTAPIVVGEYDEYLEAINAALTHLWERGLKGCAHLSDGNMRSTNITVNGVVEYNIARARGVDWS